LDFFFREKKIVFSIVLSAFYNLFQFLNENPSRTDQRKLQISLKESGLVDSGFVKTCDEFVIGVFQQARDQYMACMDLEKIEKKGLEPLLSLLKKFGGWPVLEDNWNEANFKWYSP
jgi:hypothetical protein